MRRQCRASSRSFEKSGARRLCTHQPVIALGYGSMCPDMISHSAMPSACMFRMIVGMSAGSPERGRSWKLKVSTPNTTPLIVVGGVRVCRAIARDNGTLATSLPRSRRLNVATSTSRVSSCLL